MELSQQLQISIWISSSFAGLSTYLITYPLIRVVLTSGESGSSVWHRSEPRWNRLRASSKLFHNLEKWIVGIAHLIELYLPWFVKLPVPVSYPGRMSRATFQMLFGNTESLASACRSGGAREPWSTSEFVATGFLAATAAAVMTAVILASQFSMTMLVILVIATWVGTYRWWRWRICNAAKKRRSQIRRFLPHAIETIAMVMTSSGTFREGLSTLVQDFPGHPLSIELARIRADLDMGELLQDALQNAAGRIGLEEFEELVLILQRVHRHGSPAEGDFRRMASQLRDVQLRHLESSVGRAEAMMSGPIACVMFSAMLIAVAPFLLSVMNSELLSP